MPTYDYACANCGHVTEVMHGVHDAGPEKCERCGGPMRKLMSRPSIHFKGAGWAKKDASAARPAGTAKSGTETEKDHGSAAAEKGDSKSAGDAKPAAADAGADSKSSAGSSRSEA